MILFILGFTTAILLLFIGCKASKRIREFVIKTLRPNPPKSKTLRPNPPK